MFAAEDWRIVAFTVRTSASAILAILPPGLLLAFTRALGEFGATILVAGNIPGRTTTLSLAIYQLVQLGRDAEAYRLLAVSVAVAFAAVWTSERFLRGKGAG